MVYLSATSLCLLICFHSKWQFSILRWALRLGLQKDDGPIVGELVIFFFFSGWSLGICTKSGSCSLIAFSANPEFGRRKMKQRTQVE